MSLLIALLYEFCHASSITTAPTAAVGYMGGTQMVVKITPEKIAPLDKCKITIIFPTTEESAGLVMAGAISEVIDDCYQNFFKEKTVNRLGETTDFDLTTASNEALERLQKMMFRRNNTTSSQIVTTNYLANSPPPSGETSANTIEESNDPPPSKITKICQ